MSPKDAPSLTIAIVSHGQISLVERLLNTLSSHKPEIDFQVVILENVPDHPKIDFSHYEFKLTYLKNQISLGLSRNINLIFDKFCQDSDYFCILNPDIIFEDEVFSGLLTAMETHQIDIIAPLIVNTNQEIQDSFRPIPNPVEIILRFLNLIKSHYDYDSLPIISYPDWIAAMFLLMPSQIFKKVGGFNPRYRLYFEDVDFCVRARNMNLTIGVIKTIRVIHDGQRTSHKNVLFLFHHIVSALKFFVSKEYRSKHDERTKRSAYK